MSAKLGRICRATATRIFPETYLPTCYRPNISQKKLCTCKLLSQIASDTYSWQFDLGSMMYISLQSWGRSLATTRQGGILKDILSACKCTQAKMCGICGVGDIHMFRSAGQWKLFRGASTVFLRRQQQGGLVKALSLCSNRCQEIMSNTLQARHSSSLF